MRSILFIALISLCAWLTTYVVLIVFLGTGMAFARAAMFVVLLPSELVKLVDPIGMPDSWLFVGGSVIWGFLLYSLGRLVFQHIDARKL